MKIKLLLSVTLVAASLIPGLSNAALVLDTGAPSSAALPVMLDANDFYAAQFNLSAGSTVNSINAFITNAAFMDSPGDTFTVSLYGSDLLTNRFAAPVFSAQGTYTTDGWNGVSGLNWQAVAAGSYWAAFEVNAGSDTAVGLTLPTPTTGGTAPAQAFAFNSGSGYTSTGALPFGIQVDAVTPVPVPPALWLLGSGVAGLAGMVRRRKSVVRRTTQITP